MCLKSSALGRYPSSTLAGANVAPCVARRWHVCRRVARAGTCGERVAGIDARPCAYDCAGVRTRARRHSSRESASSKWRQLDVLLITVWNAWNGARAQRHVSANNARTHTGCGGCVATRGFTAHVATRGRSGCGGRGCGGRGCGSVQGGVAEIFQQVQQAAFSQPNANACSP